MIHECSICHRIQDCGMTPEDCGEPIIIAMNCRDRVTFEEYHTEEWDKLS